MRITSALACAGLVVLSTLSSYAQVRYRPTENGPWRPWSFTAIASTRQDRGATAAEVQAWQARLQELAAIVKRAPAVAQPVGFAGEMWGNLNGYRATAPGQPPGKSIPLSGSLSFGAFPLIEFIRNGKLMNEDMKGGETALLQFTVNEIGMGVYRTSRPPEWSSADVEGFLEPVVGEPYKGLPRIDDVYVLKRHDKPLWVPMPLAEAMKPFIDVAREQYENRRDVYAKQVEDFEQWQTPAARAARRADWEHAAKLLPNGQEFLANMEKTDREIETMNRTRLAPGGPEERGAKEAEQDLRAAEAALAAFSPERRAAPSCYVAEAPSPAEKFRPLEGTGTNCRAIVKPNWGYFDSMLPRSAPQVLMLIDFERCLSRESLAGTTRGGCVVNRELVNTLDWDSVRAWLAR
jgi:hypothetical protein